MIRGASISLTAALIACCVLSSLPARAQVMTVRDYVNATNAGGERATQARRYLDGVVQGILVVDDLLEESDGALFCVADDEVETLTLQVLRQEFGSWLQVAARGNKAAEIQDIDVPTLAVGFFTQRMPCGDEGSGSTGQGGASVGPEDGADAGGAADPDGDAPLPDMKSLLLENQ